MADVITEFVTSRGADLKVDNGGGVIRGVKVLGGVSKNGRQYPEATLEAALEKYHETRVNVDHPEGDPATPRSYKDRIGMLRDPVVKEGSIYADLYYNPEHALAKQLEWDAEHSPDSLGLSHNVSGRVRREGGTVVVEEIAKVLSVDLVADPATTRSLFESFTGDQDMPEELNLTEVTIDQLEKDAPKLFKAITERAIAAHDDSTEVEQLQGRISTLEAEIGTGKTKLTTVTEERDELKTEKTAKEKYDAIEQLLSKSKLPEAVLTEDIRKQAHSYADADGAKQYVATLEGAVQRAASKPESVEQMLAEGEDKKAKVTDGKSLLNAIT